MQSLELVLAKLVSECSTFDELNNLKHSIAERFGDCDIFWEFLSQVENKKLQMKIKLYREMRDLDAESEIK